VAERVELMPKKKLFINVTRPDTHPGMTCTYHYDTFSIDNEMDGAEVGDSITLTLVEMTEEEYKDLGDFDGW
jgi:hypothetical protein